MGSLPTSPTDHIYVPEETQASINVLKNVRKFFSEETTKNEVTNFHNQNSTNLCHSFSLMSGFRLILRYFFETEISDPATRDSILEMFKPDQESNFYRMLAVFNGCVNPRSFDELFKVHQ